MIRSPQRQLAPGTVGPGIDETTSLRGIADKAEHDKTVFSLTAEVSINEEPGAVVPHAGICAGGAG